MARHRVIVQASSRSWSGAQDLCMARVEGRPVIYWTIKRILDSIPEVEVRVAAPAFDHGGALEFLSDIFGTGVVSIFYGHDASPLNRMLEICQDLENDDHIIRVDGLHFCVDTHSSLKMLQLAQSERFDCVKFPDDFPVQFTSDLYRVEALRKLDRLLNEDTEAIFRVHPKFYLFMRDDQFRCAYLQELPVYKDEFFQQCRETAKSIYRVPRLEVNDRRVWSGDQLSFHYELAARYLAPSMKVLDIACGDGYGTRKLADQVDEVHGGDIDPDVIAQAGGEGQLRNIRFHTEDITKMSFPENMFDAVVSMETIEHVAADDCLREIRRVLKPGGLSVISTPQNILGRIPINAMHVREYSLEEIVELCERYLTVREVIGIKAGRIVIPGSPKGTNTVIVCEKSL
jgi:2-polyprenyl-3-methyl-5-hydroxy-6-metoxy-1,4-benzoquinol methylase